jgi:hypothetical protein
MGGHGLMFLEETLSLMGTTSGCYHDPLYKISLRPTMAWYCLDIPELVSAVQFSGVAPCSAGVGRKGHLVVECFLTFFPSLIFDQDSGPKT